MHTLVAASADTHTAHVESHVEASLVAVRAVGREVLVEHIHPPRFAKLYQPTSDVDHIPLRTNLIFSDTLWCPGNRLPISKLASSSIGGVPLNALETQKWTNCAT
ncbi:hypothetical protein PIB30_098123 [Stylosanthes scabra]|uniref:Uncharacterized protein n=1 Tax=Stylosanthes scabra TaxID=79078 RepID=A0ABU6YVT2_9FABA|nr:hypothetical protein [Stylosanthes scabra]